MKAGACPLDSLAHFLPLMAANVRTRRALEREQGEARCERWAETPGPSGLRLRILALLEARSDIATEE